MCKKKDSISRRQQVICKANDADASHSRLHIAVHSSVQVDERADYDSNIALEVFDYPLDVEVNDCLFAGAAADVGQ